MITFIEQGNRIATENFEIGEIYTITFTNGNYKTMCCIGLGSDFVMFQDKLPNALFCLTLGTAETVSTIEIGGGGSGTMNYNELENKPQINGIVLIGNKTAAELDLASTSDIAGKQDSLTETQLTAVNSGITNSLVAQIGTNTTAISGKQDQLSTAQLTAVNSGITSSLVTQIGTNQNNISNIDSDTTLLKNTITTIRFASGVSRSWQFTQRTNYHIFMVFGFVQGVGLVYWACKIDNTGTLKVYDTLTNTEVTQSTISYSVADSVGTVTIQSSVAQWSYLTIIKNAEIT